MKQKEKAKIKPDISILVKTGHFYFGLTCLAYYLDIQLRFTYTRKQVLIKKPGHAEAAPVLDTHLSAVEIRE